MKVWDNKKINIKSKMIASKGKILINVDLITQI